MDGKRTLRRIRSSATAFLMLLLAAATTTPALSQPARDPKLAPAPEYLISANGFAPYARGFTTPQAAGAYIETWHLSLAWPDFYGNPTLHCPATAERFTAADFVANSPPSSVSQQTTLRSITRQQSRCTYDAVGNCIGVSCGTDPTTYRYAMTALCDNGWMNFVSTSGGHRCECFQSNEHLERDADGRWRCTSPQVPSVANAACYRHDGSCPVGNPAMPGVAAKVHTEVDYEGAGAHPLSFTRSFRSHGARPYVEPGAWSHWVHNWARRIEVYPETGHRGRAYVVRDDASQRIYTTTGNGTWTTLQQGDRSVLTEQRDAAGARTGFLYTLWADDSVEHYDPAGRLLRVVQRNGWTNTLTYSDAATPATIAPRAGLLISVRNHFGRELKFTYDAAGRLAELLPPGAVSGTAPGSATSPIRYLHNEPTGLGAGVPALNQPTSVVWQDGAVRRYHYENAQFPQWLTGRTDELGVRIGTYTYNTSGQLVRSEGPGGINAVEFAYLGSTTQVTDRSGTTPTTSTYTWEEAAGLIRPTAVSAPCPQCGSTSARTAYYASGDVARRVDHDGRITFYLYDAKGRETERATFPAAYNTATTRPALSVAERVVSTKWHATWNLPTQVAEPQKVTAYTYGTGGRPTGESWTASTDATGAAKFNAVKTGSTYATGYSYNANVLPSTVIERVDGLEVQRWMQAFNALGDVTRVTDVTSGGAAVISAINPAGKATAGTTDTNTAIAVGYSPRGLLVNLARGGVATAFTYDARGLLVTVLLPDTTRFDLEYDALGAPIGTRMNGMLVSPTTLALGRPATVLAANVPLAIQNALNRLTDALLPRAFAQVLIWAEQRPRRPEFDPRTDMLMAPMTAADRAKRWLEEQRQRRCQCDPLGGYTKPTLTPGTYMHLWYGGHMKAMFSDQSYFTVPANQALVDQIVATTQPDPQASDEEKLVFRGRVSEYIGRMPFPKGSGTFVETKKVTIIVQRSNCSGTRARNEVVTMHPGHRYQDGP